MKKCKRCNFVGEDVLFVSGSNICKSCKKEDRRKYDLENKEHIAAQKKLWHESNRDKILSDKRKKYKEIADSEKLRVKIYRQNNKDKVSEYNKRYALENKDSISDYKRNWRKENKDVRCKGIIK